MGLRAWTTAHTRIGQAHVPVPLISATIDRLPPDSSVPCLLCRGRPPNIALLPLLTVPSTRVHSVQRASSLEMSVRNNVGLFWVRALLSKRTTHGDEKKREK